MPGLTTLSEVPTATPRVDWLLGSRGPARAGDSAVLASMQRGLREAGARFELVWDPGEFTHGGRHFRETSSAPCLTVETGSRWQTPAELGRLLDSRSWQACAPRRWVLENLTDRISADRLLEIAQTEPVGDR